MMIDKSEMLWNAKTIQNFERSLIKKEKFLAKIKKDKKEWAQGPNKRPSAMVEF